MRSIAINVSVCMSVCLSVCPLALSQKEAQLPQRDATRYVSKFVLFHEVWELERFQTAKVTLMVI